MSIETPILDAVRLGGNGGHNKFMPRWEVIESPSFAAHLPEILKDAIIELFRYYENPDLIPTLSHLSDHTRQDGEARCNRSEAREIDVLVMVSILFHTDLTTLRIATPKKGGAFINRSTKELAQCIGMICPTTGRASRKFQRCFARLRNAAILTTSNVSGTNKAGEIRRRNSAKAISEDFLATVLGGTKEALQRVKKARQGHSKATRAQRTDTAPAPQKDAVLNMQRGAAAIKTKKIDKMIEEAQEATIMASPEGKARAYSKAKGEYQRRLLDQGLTSFHEVHAMMAKFPTIENWHP